MEAKIKLLLTRHAILTKSNEINYTRLKFDAINRIEKQYKELTGYELKENSGYQIALDECEKQSNEYNKLQNE